MFVLTVTGSGGELRAGIPNFITITPSDPATTYYTIDGSEPTISNSYIYVNPIPILNEALDIITVKTFAITAVGDVSECFIKSFIETIPSPFEERPGDRANTRGIIINTPPSLSPPDIVKAFDSEGVDSVFQDESDLDYEIIVSSGELITVVSTPSRTTVRARDDWESTNVNSADFNPRARVINIDSEDPDNQINILMRPYGSMRDSTKMDLGSEMYEHDTYVSGGYMRTMYSHATGKVESFYFDSNSLQYSIVSRDIKPGEYSLNLNTVTRGRASSLGKIFSWIYPGRGNLF